MPGNGSILQNIVDRIRVELDEAEVDAKYTDAYLLENTIPAAISDVLERLNADRKNKIVATFDLTTVANQNYYRLPANIGQVIDLFHVDSGGETAGRVPYRSAKGPWGPGYAVQGNELHVDPALPGGRTVRLVYMPTGGFLPHYATDGTLNADKDEITLSSSPSLGILDRREGAYSGQVVRIVPASGPIESAVINQHTYDGSNWKITLRRPATHADAGAIRYEIIDHPSLSLVDSIVYAAIIRVAVSRRVNRSVVNSYRIMYNSALKTEGDRVANQDLKANKYDEDTRYRNTEPNYGLFGRW